MAENYRVPPSPLFDGARNTTITILAFFAAVIIAAAFDPASVGFTRDASVRGIARAFSALGNGATLIIISLLIYLAGRAWKRVDLRELGSRCVQSIVIGSVAVHLLKAAFDRPRPAYSGDAILHFIDKTAMFDLTGWFNSFPSGHTTVSFAVAFVLSRRLPRFAPLIYTAAVLIGLSRIYLGSHYPTDVAGGAAIGLTVGWLLSGAAGGAGTAGGERQPWGRWLVAGLALLAVFVAFFKTGGFFLFDVDEAVFSEAAREMLATGDLITPTYNFEPRYDKPILIYWFMSAAFWLFGVGEFSARFTSSGFGVLLVMMTYAFLRRVKGGLLPFVASLALLVNLEFFVYSHSAVTDMTLTFFITASLYAFYLGLDEDRPGWFKWAWAAAAMAVLTKGIIGVMFPSVIAFVYLAATGRLSMMARVMRPSYIVLFLAISAPWFAAEYAVNGREFFDAFIIKHHIQRYSGVVSGHGAPAYFYIPVIIAGFFPWVAFLPSAIRRGVGEAMTGSGTGRGGRGGLLLFSLIWFTFILLFFSASGTKLPNYIFPLFPAMAIMAGAVITTLIEDRENEGEGSKKPGLFILLIISLMVSSALILLPSHDPQMEVAFAPVIFYALGGIFLAISLLTILAYAAPRYSLLGIFAVVVVLLCYLRIEAVPPVSAHLQGTLFEYSDYARSLGDDATLATFEINKPSVAFYSRGPVLKIERGNMELIEEYGGAKKLIIITTPALAAELTAYEGLRVMDERSDYALVANSSELPALAPEPEPATPQETLLPDGVEPLTGLPDGDAERAPAGAE